MCLRWAFKLRITLIAALIARTRLIQILFHYFFVKLQFISVILGESVRSKTGGITKMLYRYHSCKFGDDGDLREFIESEILMKNPSLLTGEYGEIVCRLIDKIRSYGTRNVDSTDYGGEVIRCPKSSKVSYLSDYRKTVSSGKGRRFCHIN